MKQFQEDIAEPTSKGRLISLLKSILNKKRELFLFLLLLALFVLFEAFVMNGEYIANRWKGLEVRQYKIRERDLFDFQKQQGALLALSDDPNVTLDDLNLVVESILLDGCTNTNPEASGQIFYRKSDEDFEESHSIIYGYPLNRSQIQLGLPSPGVVASLRFDLTNKKGDLITCREFVINPSPDFNFSILRIGIYFLPILLGSIYIFRDTGPASFLIQKGEQNIGMKIDQHAVGNAFAVSWFALLGMRALTTVDKTFDSLAYHLPFAARAAGIFPKAGYLFEYNLEHVYEGFPLLIEFFQGLLWKFSGWITATNLVSLLFFLLLALFASRRLKIPFWQIALFFSSVPLILIHSIGSNIDLPIACLFSFAFLNLIHVILKDDYSYRSLILILLPLAIATNAKFTIVPPAALLTVITLLLFFINLRGQWQDQRVRSKQLIVYLTIISVMSIVGAGTLIKNSLLYQNPVYPLTFQFWFLRFEGTFVPDGGVLSSVANPLVNMVHYLLSLSEIQLWKTSTDFLWTVDMYNIYKGSTIRYGGYFIANIVLWWLCILFLLRSSQNSKHRLIAFLVFLFWFFVGFLPESFELRYNMYLPIMLALTLLLILKEYRQSQNSETTLYGFVHGLQIAIFMFVVLNLPHYIYPLKDYQNIDTVTYGFHDPQYQLVALEDPVCLPGRIPYTFLYKLQNPELDLQAAYSEESCIYPPLE